MLWSSGDDGQRTLHNLWMLQMVQYDFFGHNNIHIATVSRWKFHEIHNRFHQIPVFEASCCLRSMTIRLVQAHKLVGPLIHKTQKRGVQLTDFGELQQPLRTRATACGICKTYKGSCTDV